MIGMKISDAKGLFFDKNAVLTPTEKAKRKALSKFGAYVRSGSRRSIRKVGKSGAPAKPGQPPKSRTGLLKRFIFFVYDKQNDSVIIGPAALNGTKEQNRLATEVMEIGGSVTRDGKRYVYAKHPYMEPAFQKELPKAAAMFSGEIK